MSDGAMKTVEYVRVDTWFMLDWIMSQDCRNSFLWHELLTSGYTK